jgi:outer membrane receptor for ferrienterochelin and colicin
LTRSLSLRWAVLVGLSCALVFPRGARADDLADEADLQFQLGADRYKEGDFRGALEHFLASNRLVPNRNVSFNIARSYEQLKLYPEAFRYYTQALEAETDPAARARVETALGHIKPNVAVLKVVTEPPGATIYINRRDLGPRGSSPKVLGLAAGRYKVIAELAGYHPAESLEVDTQLAGETELHLKLEPKLEGLTGTLVVNADERGALIEVDGKPRAFTPSIVTVPAGTHSVRISLKGFRTVTQTLEVPPNAEKRLELVLTQAEEVTAASRTTQAVEDAPSSVSILRSEELRGMEYPTIVEALRGVRGVFVGDDRSYPTVGFRGIGRLGSYGNRVLVLLDGQPTNDDWIGSSYLGYDARTDLADIERIEVVRGPGSVLYGTNAFSGVINLVTRGTEKQTSREVGVGTNEYGVARARARYNLTLSDNASVWTSAAAAQGAGRDFFFPEYATSTPPDVAGNARGLDGFKSGTINGRFTAGPFTTLWFLHSRNKHSPTAAYGTLFGDSRFQQVDTRGLVEVRYEPQVTRQLQLMSRANVNYYTFRGLYPKNPADGGLERDTFDGTWMALEQRVVFTPSDAVRLTLGGEGQFHTHVVETVKDEQGTYLDDSQPYSVQAAYLLADVSASRAMRLSAGARFDHYSTFGSSLNPRIAVIVHPYDAGVLKFMVGKAFRAPSIYELSYNDGGFSQRASPDLRPESIYSGEVEYSHRFSPTTVGTLSGYGNVATNLVVQRDATATDLIHYENIAAPLFTVGAEAEVRREWRQGWMLAASYSAQHSRYLPDAKTLGQSVSDAFGGKSNPLLRRVANAPEHLASIRGAVPILSHGLLASTRLSIEGPRFDRHEEVSGPPQRTTDAGVIWDLVLSGDEPRWGIHYALGVYNVFDFHYAVPLSGEFAQNSIVQAGRTFLASASTTF